MAASQSTRLMEKKLKGEKTAYEKRVKSTLRSFHSRLRATGFKKTLDYYREAIAEGNAESKKEIIRLAVHPKKLKLNKFEKALICYTAVLTDHHSRSEVSTSFNMMLWFNPKLYQQLAANPALVADPFILHIDPISYTWKSPDLAQYLLEANQTHVTHIYEALMSALYSASFQNLMPYILEYLVHSFYLPSEDEKKVELLPEHSSEKFLFALRKKQDTVKTLDHILASFQKFYAVPMESVLEEALINYDDCHSSLITRLKYLTDSEREKVCEWGKKNLMIESKEEMTAINQLKLKAHYYHYKYIDKKDDEKKQDIEMIIKIRGGLEKSSPLERILYYQSKPELRAEFHEYLQVQANLNEKWALFYNAFNQCNDGNVSLAIESWKKSAEQNCVAAIKKLSRNELELLQFAPDWLTINVINLINLSKKYSILAAKAGCPEALRNLQIDLKLFRMKEMRERHLKALVRFSNDAALELAVLKLEAAKNEGVFTARNFSDMLFYFERMLQKDCSLLSERSVFFELEHGIVNERVTATKGFKETCRSIFTRKGRFQAACRNNINQSIQSVHELYNKLEPHDQMQLLYILLRRPRKEGTLQNRLIDQFNTLASDEKTWQKTSMTEPWNIEFLNPESKLKYLTMMISAIMRATEWLELDKAFVVMSYLIGNDLFKRFPKLMSPSLFFNQQGIKSMSLAEAKNSMPSRGGHV